MFIRDSSYRNITMFNAFYTLRLFQGKQYQVLATTNNYKSHYLHNSLFKILYPEVKKEGLVNNIKTFSSLNHTSQDQMFTKAIIAFFNTF